MTALDVGAALRLMRVESGLSLREVARRVGVSGAYLSRVENGHDPAPTPDRLAGIAAALGVPSALLLELTQEVPPAAAAYLRETPGAAALLLDLVRHRPSSAQIAQLRAALEMLAPARDAERPARHRLAPLLHMDRMVLRLACRTLEDAVDLAAARLAALPGAASDRDLAQCLRDPQMLAVCGLGAGVMVPHATLPGLPLRAAIVTLATALDASVPGHQQVQTLVVLAGAAAREQMVEVLLQVARLAGYGLSGELAACRTEQEALALLHTMEAAMG